MELHWRLTPASLILSLVFPCEMTVKLRENVQRRGEVGSGVVGWRERALTSLGHLVREPTSAVATQWKVTNRHL